MRFLLHRFDSYDKLLQNLDLILTFRAEDIKNAASEMKEKERDRFCGLLSIDNENLDTIKKFANVWDRAKKHDSGIKDLFEFMEKLYWLKQPEGCKIQHFNRLHEGYFEFRVPLTSPLRTVIVYITRDGDVVNTLDLLSSRLGQAMNEYKILRGNELVFLVPLLEARHYQLYPDWSRFNNVVLIDEGSILQYIRSSNREMELLGQVSKYLKVHVLSPYKTSLSVYGNMFVGRGEELERVLNNPKSSFSVVGERKIGKTSFLRQIQYEYQRTNQDGVHPVYISWNAIYDEPGIYRQFSENEDMKDLFGLGLKDRIRSAEDLRTNVRRFLNREKRDRIVFLIDEVDGLIENFQYPCPECKEAFIIKLWEDISDNPPQCPKCRHRFTLSKIEGKKREWKPEIENVLRIFDTFRSLALEYPGRCQFIFTGFELLHKLHRDYRSAFLNFTERIDLGLLKYPDVKKLVVEPMRKLGVGFRDEAKILNTIFNESCGLPWGIQYFCHRIIKKLSESSNRTVDDKIVSEVTPQMRNEIRQHLKDILYRERWRSLYDLTARYAQEFKEDFSANDLMTFHEMIAPKSEELFTEREMKKMLAFFAICFFLEKKEGNKFNINQV